MDRRILKTKQAIVTAFLELLDEKKSLDKISITDITRRADISRSTFYFHYSGTGHLIEEICNSFAQRIYSIILKAHEEISSENQYLFMYREILNFLYKNKTITHLLLLSPKEQDMTQRICENIQKHLTAYYLSKQVPISKEVLNTTATFSTYGLLSIIKSWANAGFNRPPKEMAELTFQAMKVADLFFREQT